ncbi:hypothetical protein N7481_012624 [Penicillium waksmanii]|uniref:uncharacterized protein n=1 Tax=Penicillium waksmanii TaxID=69791 RepID=UPI002547CD3F|nr:uncharacterized protein N7481_012624 [Penicillium waksmanii]KAJ5965910.1 hypothetical protein N7481_012624 [Penicillium waksmanii]
MTEHAMAPNYNNIHPRQQSRLREQPSSRNAQGLFSPDACLFIGNLCSKTNKEQQEREIESVFAVYGPCYAKVKIDKGSALHGAFVQFEKVEDAQKVLHRDAQGHPINLNGRNLRVERAKGQRTARLSLRSGAHITEEEARQVLEPSGPLEGMCLDKIPLLSSDSTATCLATFAFVEDYNDAIKDFLRDSKYVLEKTKYKGNPFANGGKPGPEPHEPHTSQAAHERGRHNGYGHHRNGPTSYRGNPRGFERGFPRNPSRRGSHQSNSSQDYQSQYSQDFNQYPEPFQSYSAPYNPSALNQPMPSRMAPGAPVFVPGQSNCASSANTYGNPPLNNPQNYHPPNNTYNGPPNNVYNGPPLNNTYNCPPQSNMYNGPPPNHTYNGPTPNVGNNSDVNGYNNQQHMGPGGYNPGYYQGPCIVSTPTTYNNPPPMYANGFQQPPPPQNGYYPQYMPQGDQMNGQHPPQFGQEQCYPQGPGYLVPPPGPNMNMPYMAQPYNNTALSYHPAQPAQPAAPPVNNPTVIQEKTDAPEEPAQNPGPEYEPEQKPAAATTDEPKPNGDKSHAENASDGALDSDKKEETKPEEVQSKPEDPVESPNCPTPSTDATIQPKQNRNNHDSDAKEGILTNEEQSPTENEIPSPPENPPNLSGI